MLTYLTTALPWDLAIFLLIAFGVALMFFAWRWKKGSRRLRLSVAFLGSILAATVFYGSFVEPRIITVTEETVTLPTVNDLTIVVLSDLHVGPYKGRGFVRRIVDRVNALRPDIVFLDGDFVYLGADPTDRLSPLEDIVAPLGVFGVLGNHEYVCYMGHIRSETYGMFDPSQQVLRALERVGVIILTNESREISLPLEKGGPLFVAGIDDACSGHDDLGAALPATTRKSSVILLAHDPSVILDQRATYPNLIISGHTHGGQIRLPFIGPLAGLPTQIDPSYDQGLFAIDGNTTLAITRGIGEAGPRARLFAPPEIMMIRVEKEKAD